MSHCSLKVVWPILKGFAVNLYVPLTFFMHLYALLITFLSRPLRTNGIVSAVLCA